MRRAAAKGVRSKINIDSLDVGQHGSSPRIRRKQPHNPASSPSQTAASVSQALASHTEQRLPPAMTMPPEARSVWNLKILRRHDPLISRIFDQAPYGVLYTFNHAHAHEPDGGKGRKYEGTWEKTGIEGTVFLVERSVSPQYGFFLLNRGGTASVFQMLHQDDTVELGTDPKFLTFRPGLWDHATTPYTEPFTRCDKPSLVCLWLSDETAGPRFAYFISKTKSLLSRGARHPDTSTSSPPPLPLVQPADPTPKQSTVTPQDVEGSLDASGNENLTSEASERPLDKLFASFAQPPNTKTSAAPPQTRSATSGVNSAASIEEVQSPIAPTNPIPTSIPSFAQDDHLSLLDQIFASVASETTSAQLVGASSGPSATTHVIERTDPEFSLDVNRATAALLDSLQSHRSGETDDAGSIHISKRDFISQLLTLIHEPGFIDDLYARYETLTRWNQMA